MYIEERLNNLDSKLDSVLKILLSGTAIPANESGLAGAAADPVVAAKVDAAIAAATPEAPKRGRGRPSKTTETVAPAQPVVAATTTAPVSQPDPFALDGPTAAPEAKPRTLTEVKAAMLVYQQQNSQENALKLLKDIAGVETLAAVAKADPAVYSKLFKAAIPADKLSLADVRAVLVAANARKNGGGMEVLQKFGAAEITQLTEDKFVDAILFAHTIK